MKSNMTLALLVFVFSFGAFAERSSRQSRARTLNDSDCVVQVKINSGREEVPAWVMDKIQDKGYYLIVDNNEANVANLSLEFKMRIERGGGGFNPLVLFSPEFSDSTSRIYVTEVNLIKKSGSSNIIMASGSAESRNSGFERSVNQALASIPACRVR